MSRFIKKDFNELVSYLEEFNLKKLAINKEYIEIISVYHKKYFSYFVFVVELENKIPDNEYLYFKESNSDLINSFFHLTTGNYKSCKLLLRSSLECFIKAFNLSFIPNLEKEKSVYEMFDKVKTSSYFELSPFKEHFANLQNIYKLLCKDVHTAEEINMESISSLDFFPKFSKKKSKLIIDIILKMIPTFCFLISHKYNEIYHKIHHNHREIILSSIEKKFRPIIMNMY